MKTPCCNQRCNQGRDCPNRAIHTARMNRGGALVLVGVTVFLLSMWAVAIGLIWSML